MVVPNNKQESGIDSLIAAAQEDDRLLALVEMGLLEAETLPVFEEATRNAAEFLDIPISILGLLDKDRQWLLGQVGLSEIVPVWGTNPIPYLPRSECFCGSVVESREVVSIRDTATHRDFAKGPLVQKYGIRAYLGVPLLTAQGYCVGTLAVMDLAPRSFTTKQIQFLQLTARWSMSEFERQRLSHRQGSNHPQKSSLRQLANTGPELGLKVVKSQMLTRLTEALRTPLTSVLGMASVLGRGIYGPLTNKQQEYLNIIHDSGRYLLSLVDEILALAEVRDSNEVVNPMPIDIEMLCQQVINALEQDANRREQQMRLSVEPGHRLWVLDKAKVQQLLYNLIFCIIQSATAGSIIRTHVSRKKSHLHLTVSVSHPWLGEGLPLAVLSSCYVQPVATPAPSGDRGENTALSDTDLVSDRSVAPASLIMGQTMPSILDSETADSSQLFANMRSRESLGLLFSCILAQSLGGEISIQGSPQAGYRYQVSLPEISSPINDA